MAELHTILLTGGSGKLGRRWIAHLLARGHTVITTSRHEETLQTLLADNRGPNADGRLHGWSIDLSEADAIRQLIGLIEQTDLRPDCLVNNARSRDALRVESDGSVTRQNFVTELLIDVVAPYELTMALAIMKDSRLKRVVNVSSIYGIVAANQNLYEDPATQSPIHYSVAKAALVHLTRELAVRLAGRGICVNAISLAGVEGRVDDTFRDRYARLCPQGRMLQEREAIGPLEFLLSDDASGVTGHNLVVDGGWSAW